MSTAVTFIQDVAVSALGQRFTVGERAVVPDSFVDMLVSGGYVEVVKDDAPTADIPVTDVEPPFVVTDDPAPVSRRKAKPESSDS